MIIWCKWRLIKHCSTFKKYVRDQDTSTVEKYVFFSTVQNSSLLNVCFSTLEDKQSSMDEKIKMQSLIQMYNLKSYVSKTSRNQLQR